MATPTAVPFKIVDEKEAADTLAHDLHMLALNAGTVNVEEWMEGGILHASLISIAQHAAVLAKHTAAKFEQPDLKVIPSILIMFPKGDEDTDLEAVVNYLQDAEAPIHNGFTTRFVDIELHQGALCDFLLKEHLVYISKPIVWDRSDPDN